MQAASPLPTRPARREQRRVLAVNAGSSTLKVGLYGEGTCAALWTGAFTGLQPGGVAQWCARDAAPVAVPTVDGDAWQACLALLLQLLDREKVEPVAVAHRIVHGGDRFVAPCRLDEPALMALDRLASLAPLHQPHNLEGVRAFMALWPHLPQIGCFDTAFHATLPVLERRLPLPGWLVEQGLRRYGFHGLSYEYVAHVLAQVSPRAHGRVLLAHLGNGASLCAMQGGRSVATSMGFSALDGLVMGTRCGSLDVGVVLHLWRAGWDLARVESLLYRESGLKGVSGLSADMRTLRADDSPDARLAIDLFHHRARREAGALMALLGGLDAVAFTGGIGEHDAATRAALCESLAPWGVRLDEACNARAPVTVATPVHAADSSAEVWVVPTDEGRTAATAAFNLLDRTALCTP